MYINLTPTRGDVHRVRIFEIELMEWYGKRASVRQSGLAWGIVEDAIIDLLKYKPYMNARAPRPPYQSRIQKRTPPRMTVTGKTQSRDKYLSPDQLNNCTPTLSYSRWRHDPSRSYELEPDAYPTVNGSDQRATSKNRTARARPYGRRTASLSEGSTCWSNMGTDDNDNEARIASQYRMLTMHDPEILSVPEADDETGRAQGSRC